MIEGTPIFAKLSAEDLELLLTRLSERAYAAGEEVIAQGSANNTFYIIKQGVAAVMQSDAPGSENASNQRLAQGHGPQTYKT